MSFPNSMLSFIIVYVTRAEILVYRLVLKDGYNLVVVFIYLLFISVEKAHCV